MVNKCCVSTCNAEWKPGHLVTFHKFPLKQPDLLKKWLDSIPNLKFMPGAYTVICGDHFTRDSFSNLHTTKRRLRRNAVPTLFGYDAGEQDFPDIKQEHDEICVYKMNGSDDDPDSMLQNFVSVQDYECSSSNNEDVSNNIEDATGSDTPIGVMPYNNEDSASNNEVASNHEEIVTVPQEKRKTRKKMHLVNASTQTMPRPMYRSLFLEKRARRKIKMLEQRLKRREKMVLAVTFLLRTMTENW